MVVGDNGGRQVQDETNHTEPHIHMFVESIAEERTHEHSNQNDDKGEVRSCGEVKSGLTGRLKWAVVKEETDEGDDQFDNFNHNIPRESHLVCDLGNCKSFKNKE